MANAAVQVTDEVDLLKVNELRADTTGDITIDKVNQSIVMLKLLFGVILYGINFEIFKQLF